MLTAVFAASAYVLGAFLSGALMVRFFPQAYAARHIRKHLILLLVFPALIAIDLVSGFAALSKVLHKLARSSFEMISGRKLYVPQSIEYSYSGYRIPRRNRRKSDRGKRARTSVLRTKRQA